MADNTELVIEREATIVRRWQGGGLSQATIVNENVGTATGNSNISISGGGAITTEGSTVNFQGKHLGFDQVKFLAINDIRFPRVYRGWTAFFRDCEDVTICGVDIGNGDFTEDQITEDGLHFAGGSRFAVTNCNIFCGDDCVALVHEGTDGDSPDARPRTNLQDFVLSNSTLWSVRANCFKAKVGPDYGGDNYTLRSIRRVRVANVTAKCGFGQSGAEARASGIDIGDFVGTGTDRYVSDIAIDGMTLDCSQNSTEVTAGLPLILRRVDRVQITGLRVDRPDKAATIDDANDVELRDCSFEAPRALGYNCLTVAGAANCTNIRILGGYYRSARGHGIQLGIALADPPISATVTGYQVAGVLIDQAWLNGLMIWHAFDGVVSANTINDCGKSATPGVGFGIQEIYLPSDRNLIIGNRLTNNSAGPVLFFGPNTEVVRNIADPLVFIDDSGGFRQTIDGWVVDPIPAGVIAEMSRNNFAPWAPGPPATGGQGRFRAARKGSVTGIVVTTTVASAGGFLSVTMYKKAAGVAGGAGVPTTMAVILPVGASRAVFLAPVGVHTFLAGDEIYLSITTVAYGAGGMALAAIEVED